MASNALLLSFNTVKNLSTSFFKSFPKAEEIVVEVVSDAGQKEIEWEKDQNKIKLMLSK